MSGVEIIGLVGAATTALGAIQSWQTGRYNSDLAKQQGKMAQQESRAEAAREARDNMRRMGSARAAFGKGGVQIEGSPLDVLADQAMEGKLNELIIKYGGDKARMAYKAQAKNAKLEATAAWAKASSTLLTSGASWMGLEGKTMNDLWGTKPTYTPSNNNKSTIGMGAR